MFDPASIDAMQRVRRSCDPAEVANRGKMFPDGQGEPTQIRGLHPLEKAGIIERM